MALDARHRSSIYSKLVPVLGDDDANALMTALPGSEADEFVTRGILRAEMADLRGEMRQEISGVRHEVTELRGEVKTDMADLRADMNDRFRKQTVWTTSAIIGALVANTAIIQAIS